MSGGARIYSADSGGALYRQQLLDILGEGHDIEVRGLRTRELLNVVTEVRQPAARCQVVPGRRLNPWLFLSEALWILAGRDDVAALAPYNRRIADYSDDGLRLYGAYGKRIATQIELALARLAVDPADRRCVLQIWDRNDIFAGTKDPPCNTQVMFKLREGALHMLVTCRSNDLHFGLHAVNLPTFSILQEYFAARLGAALGTQTHISQSLHIYLDGPGARVTQRMLAALDEPFVPLAPAAALFSEPLPSHAEFVQWCSDTLDNNDVAPQRFLSFARRFLLYYRAVDSDIWGWDVRGDYPEWAAMAKEFLCNKEEATT